MLYAVLFEDIEHEIEENRGKTSAGAITALERLRVEERLLHRMQCAILRESLPFSWATTPSQTTIGFMTNIRLP